MKLSKTILALVAAIAAAGFTPHEAQATQISGSLQIIGTATFNSKHLGSANSVVAFSNVMVAGGNTGAFTSIAIGTPVMMASPYIFNPSTATPGLWSVGGFTFDLQTSHIDSQSNTSLTVSGTGTIFGPAGYDPTPGTWAFTSQSAGGRPGATLSFSANTAGAAVPDGGMTMVLLGAGLLGIATFRAKFVKS